MRSQEKSATGSGRERLEPVRFSLRDLTAERCQTEEAGWSGAALAVRNVWLRRLVTLLDEPVLEHSVQCPVKMTWQQPGSTKRVVQRLDETPSVLLAGGERNQDSEDEVLERKKVAGVAASSSRRPGHGVIISHMM